MKQAQIDKIIKHVPIRLARMLRYFKIRTDRAIALLPENRQSLFHILPFLIRTNHYAFPAYIPKLKSPFGLHNYSFCTALKLALFDIFPENRSFIENIQIVWPECKRIDALFLMGSIGSIAQTDGSDFDYWVCYEQANFTPSELFFCKKSSKELKDGQKSALIWMFIFSSAISHKYVTIVLDT
jgi:adenylate cyclase class 1